MPPPRRKYKRPTKLTPTSQNVEEMSLAETTLSVRVINTLEDGGVLLVKDLLTHTYASLMKLPNFGDKTMREVVSAMAKLGIAAPKGWDKPAKLPRVAKRKQGKTMGQFDLW